MAGFDQLCGQDHVVRILKRALSRQQVAHAYLFHGEAGLGMEAAALALGAGLLCVNPIDGGCGECKGCKKVISLDHPDLRLMFPLPSMPSGKEDHDPSIHFADKLLAAFKELKHSPWTTPRIDGARQILVAQARHLKQWASLKSFEGEARVAVIFDADRMGVQAQNALLKLLEEPPGAMRLILISSDPEALLPTILSRCQQIRFRPVDTELLASWLETEGYPESFHIAGNAPATPLPEVHDLARMAAGNYGRAKTMSLNLQESEDDLWQPDCFLRDLLKPNPAELHKRLQRLEESKDRTRISQLFDDLESWLQDVDLLGSIPLEESRGTLRFPHHSKALSAFAAHFSIQRPKDLSSLFDSSRHLVARNVHLFILLVSFAQKLGHHIQRL